MSKLTQFARFVGHYAGELRTTGGVFASILRVLPIDPADKAPAEEAVERLIEAADRIEAGIGNVLDIGNISADELKAALRPLLAELLPDLLGGQVEAAVRKAVAKPAAAPKVAKLPTT